MQSMICYCDGNDILSLTYSISKMQTVETTIYCCFGYYFFFPSGEGMGKFWKFLNSVFNEMKNENKIFLLITQRLHSQTNTIISAGSNAIKSPQLNNILNIFLKFILLHMTNQRKFSKIAKESSYEIPGNIWQAFSS